MPESKVSRADRMALRGRVRLGDELRAARRSAGLTLHVVAAAVNLSPSEVSRIERGRAPWVTIAALARIAAVVGLDLWVRVYPAGEALHDIGHVGLQGSFRGLLGTALTVASEVPVGDPRDLRAWDQVLTDPRGRTVGVEFDTRFTDAQAYLRRLHLKRRDGPVDRLLVVLTDTRANRTAVATARAAFGHGYAIDDPATKAALAAGELPERDAVIFIRPVTPGRARS